MIVLLGSTGMLGSDFEGDFLRPSKIECNAGDAHQIITYLERNKADAVINCVGFCGQQTEDKKITTHELNVFATRNIALACNYTGLKLVHITTSVAGDGSSYSVAKRYSEYLVRDYCNDYSIVRTGWLFGRNNDKGFLSAVLACLHKKTSVRVYDEIGTPSYTKDVADYIRDNIWDLAKEEVVSNSGSCSRLEWALSIADIMGTDLRFEFGERKYKTTKDSSLNGSLRDWKKALRACICDKGFLTRS